MVSEQPRKSARKILPTKKFQFPSSHRTNASLIKESRERSRVCLAVRQSRGVGEPPTEVSANSSSESNQEKEST